MVVETIDFFDEEEGELPPPMTLRELVALNRAAPYEEEQPGPGAANGKPADMEVRAPHGIYLCRRHRGVKCGSVIKLKTLA